MSPELDKQLCEKYPKIFRDRHANMQVTAMCWGFDCDDGWYNILDALCSNIQHHIKWSRRDRASALRFNRALRRGLAGDSAALEHYFSFGAKISDSAVRLAKEAIQKQKFREVPPATHQVVASQIKEKFGTLRFYYTGGDSYISGLVDMAEAMSGSTCEVCGSPGKSNSDGWIRVLCGTHAGDR